MGWIDNEWVANHYACEIIGVVPHRPTSSWPLIEAVHQQRLPQKIRRWSANQARRVESPNHRDRSGLEEPLCDKVVRSKSQFAREQQSLQHGRCRESHTDLAVHTASPRCLTLDSSASLRITISSADPGDANESTHTILFHRTNQNPSRVRKQGCGTSVTGFGRWTGSPLHVVSDPVARRSASAFTGPSNIRLIRRTPAETNEVR